MQSGLLNMSMAAWAASHGVKRFDSRCCSQGWIWFLHVTWDLLIYGVDGIFFEETIGTPLHVTKHVLLQGSSQWEILSDSCQNRVLPTPLVHHDCMFLLGNCIQMFKPEFVGVIRLTFIRLTYRGICGCLSRNRILSRIIEKQHIDPKITEHFTLGDAFFQGKLRQVLSFLGKQVSKNVKKKANSPFGAWLSTWIHQLISIQLLTASPDQTAQGNVPQNLTSPVTIVFATPRSDRFKGGGFKGMSLSRNQKLLHLFVGWFFWLVDCRHIW